jgi:hypothetical protein
LISRRRRRTCAPGCLRPVTAGGRRGSRVEEVPATAQEVLALAGRLLADGVELVVMEATSDYVRSEGA